MQMKRILGIGAASLILATASVFGGTAAHADVVKFSYTYHKTRAVCEKIVLAKAAAHAPFVKRIVTAECEAVRPGEKYLGTVSWVD